MMLSRELKSSFVFTSMYFFAGTEAFCEVQRRGQSGDRAGHWDGRPGEWRVPHPHAHWLPDGGDGQCTQGRRMFAFRLAHRIYLYYQGRCHKHCCVCYILKEHVLFITSQPGNFVTKLFFCFLVWFSLWKLLVMKNENFD